METNVAHSESPWHLEGPFLQIVLKSTRDHVWVRPAKAAAVVFSNDYEYSRQTRIQIKAVTWQ